MKIKYKTKGGKTNESAELTERDARVYKSMLKRQGYQPIDEDDRQLLQMYRVK